MEKDRRTAKPVNEIKKPSVFAEGGGLLISEIGRFLISDYIILPVAAVSLLFVPQKSLHYFL